MTTAVTDSPASEPAVAADRQGHALTPPTAVRARPRWGWIVGIAVVIAALGGGAYVYLRPAAGDSAPNTFVVERRDFTIVLQEKGELKAAKSIDVKSEVEGRSTIIKLIPEGTEVAEGDLLVKLASEQIDERVRSEEIKEANAKAAAEAAAKEYEITVDEQDSAVRKAKLALDNARIELEKYEKGDWQEQMKDAELAYRRAEEVLDQKEDELRDARELYELHLFNLDMGFVEELRRPALTPTLRDVFTQHQVTLSEEATLAPNEDEENWWLITDIAKRYCARIEDGELRVYYARNFITARELRDKEFALFEAENALDKARLRKEVLHKYTHPKDLTQKESDVREAEKELARTKKSADAKKAQKLANRNARAAEYAFTQERLEKLRRQQSKTEILAPAAGLVVYDTGRRRWDSRQIAEGAEVYERQTIIKLPDTEVMQVLVRIHEGKATKVELGQAVRVEIEGMPGVVLDGEVSKIAPLADSQNQWLNPELKEYETEITLAPNDLELKPGGTARVEIFVDSVTGALSVPVQAAVTKQGRRFVFRGPGAAPEPVEVKLGRSNDEYVEVLEGLAQGDVVRLSVSEDDLQRIPERPREEVGPSPQQGVADRPQPPVPERKARPAGARGKSRTRGRTG